MEQAIPGPGSYSVSIPESGSYLIELQVIAPSLGSNSFFVSVNGQGREACHLTVTSSPQWQPVTSPSTTQPGMPGAVKSWSLPAGTATLLIEPRESGTMVNRFRVTAVSTSDPRVTAKQKLLALGLTSAEADVLINP